MIEESGVESKESLVNRRYTNDYRLKTSIKDGSDL